MINVNISDEISGEAYICNVIQKHTISYLKSPWLLLMPKGIRPLHIIIVHSLTQEILSLQHHR